MVSMYAKTTYVQRKKPLSELRNMMTDLGASIPPCETHANSLCARLPLLCRLIQSGNKRPVMLITLSCVRHAFSPPARRSGTTTNWRALRYGWLTLTGVMLGWSPTIVRGQNSAGASTTAGVISNVTITQDTQRVAIRVEGAGHLDVHAERIQNPERLALDFSGARLKVQRTSIQGVSAPVRGVRMGQLRPDVARVVVDLTASVPYQIAHEGDAVVVYLQVQPPDTNAVPTVASAEIGRAHV